MPYFLLIVEDMRLKFQHFGTSTIILRDDIKINGGRDIIRERRKMITLFNR